MQQARVSAAGKGKMLCGIDRPTWSMNWPAQLLKKVTMSPEPQNHDPPDWLRGRARKKTAATRKKSQVNDTGEKSVWQPFHIGGGKDPKRVRLDIQALITSSYSWLNTKLKGKEKNSKLHFKREWTGFGCTGVSKGRT